MQEHKIKEDEAGQRVDSFLRRFAPNLGYGTIQKWLRSGLLMVNNDKVKSSYRLKQKDVVKMPSIKTSEEIPFSLPDKSVISKLVVFERQDVIIINKPAGLATQGGAANKGEHKWPLDKLAKLLDKEARLVHRLDKDTSGLIMLARSRLISAELMQEFSEHNINKLYLAILDGKLPQKKGVIESKIDDKYAISLYRELDFADNFTFAAFMPVTGRKHQLRWHAMELGAPILGDKKVSNSNSADDSNSHSRHKKFFLHACAISLPESWQLDVFTLPPPTYFYSFAKEHGLKIPPDADFRKFALKLLADRKEKTA